MIDTSSSMLYHIGNLNDESYRISYQMASGKNMENGSENAVLHKDLIDLEDKLRVTLNIEDQLEKTQALNDSSDTNMAGVIEALDSVKIDLMKALNSGMDRSDKTALSTNLKGIREGMLDRLNTQVNDEYVFSGSVPSQETMVKDEDFDINGKVSFGGDGFLREIAVQPGSYRDRGVTAYDVAFYSSDSANAGQSFSFETGERIIDSNGNEWKLNDSKNSLQKYDYNGVKIEPLEELNVAVPMTERVKVEFSLDSTVTDAKGDYTVNIKNAAGVVENSFTYTATGVPQASYTNSMDEIGEELKNLIQAAYPSTVDNDNSVAYIDGQLNISLADKDLLIEVNDTDKNYAISATNEQEAGADKQAIQGTFTAKVPLTEYEGMVFEAKHNYFDDLNTMINALDGYTTKLDGTRGSVATDDLVSDIARKALDQTIEQFDATNVGHGELGGRNAVFENSYDTIAVQATHYELLLVEWGSADTMQLALESKALDLTYQSLFSTISKMSDMSLVNFMK